MSEERNGATETVIATGQTPELDIKKLLDAGEPKEEKKTDETPADDAGEQKKTKGDTPSPKPGRRAERRIRKTIAKLRREREEKEQALSELETLRSEVSRLRGQTEIKKPRLADFRDEDEFAEAYAKYKEEVSKRDRPLKKEEPSEKKAERFEESARDFISRGKEEFGDNFDKAMNTDNGVVASKMLQDYLVRSEHGPRLAVYLSQNPQVTKELNEETDFQDLRDYAEELIWDLGSGSREMPSFEEKKAEEPAAEPKEEPKKTEKRRRKPPPGPQVSMTPQPARGVYDEDASYDDFIADYQRRLRRKGLDR